MNQGTGKGRRINTREHFSNFLQRMGAGSEMRGAGSEMGVQKEIASWELKMGGEKPKVPPMLSHTHI